MKICVYCASSPKVSQVYFDDTATLARILVNEQHELVFGGGSAGLMGHLADTVLEAGGMITGIMPHFMKEVEWAHQEVQKFHFVEDMHERKKKLLAGSDAVIALAGGSGTLEELFEAITLKRLGLYLKPIIILNTNGFYDALKAQFERCVSEKFMRDEHLQLCSFVDTPQEVLTKIKNTPDWDEGAIHTAKV